MLGCPALVRDDFDRHGLLVETSDGITTDSENIIALGVEPTHMPYCLTPADATWILLDLQLLYHITGFQFMNSSLMTFQLAYGTARDNLSLYHILVS